MQIQKHAGLEPDAAVLGQSQSTYLAYFTSYGIQPDKVAPDCMLIGRYNCNRRTNAPSVPIMANESYCSRAFSKEMTNKYPENQKS